MLFYLGTHMPGWLGQLTVPLFVSRRRLTARKSLPRATARWCLDSGGFTELSMFGRWETTLDEYVADVRRFKRDIGRLDWVSPQDWMCEPHMLDLTGKTVAAHQVLTVDNFLRLREKLGPLVIPVLQGWEFDDYLRCVELYAAAGVDLTAEQIVGVGSVCRRQNTAEAGQIFRALAALGLRLHGFGVKATGLQSYADALASADSMAWSYRARRDHPLPGCTHKSCANCMKFALKWRDQTILSKTAQQTLWKEYE